jgi:hypothetical protein
MTILAHPVWPRIREYLHVVECARDGGVDEPRIRIEFLGLPLALVHEVIYAQMACVTCKRPINPLRRREGDTDRLYYACCCHIGVRTRCSRSAEARVEYDRFKSLVGTTQPREQLSLF